MDIVSVHTQLYNDLNIGVLRGYKSYLLILLCCIFNEGTYSNGYRIYIPPKNSNSEMVEKIEKLDYFLKFIPK